MKTIDNVVGLIPAGGLAKRLAPLPCSKELYPVGIQPIDNGRSYRPKAVCQYLIEKLQLAGIKRAYIIIRKGKWDIPDYLGDGKTSDMNLAYLIMGLPFGTPYTLDQAYPFVKNAIIAFGFPDIIFQPDNAFVRLLEKQSVSNADIVLGLFPVKEPQKWDMVDFDEDGQVLRIEIKPFQSHLSYTWIIAVWTPTFTHFMHKYITNIQDVRKTDKNNNQAAEQQEIFVGDIIQAAIENNLEARAVLFIDYDCLDIGTSEGLIKAIRNLS